jgi:hypothetical protein
LSGAEALVRPPRRRLDVCYPAFDARRVPGGDLDLARQSFRLLRNRHGQNAVLAGRLDVVAIAGVRPDEPAAKRP